jgi:hypothetical protein
MLKEVVLEKYNLQILNYHYIFKNIVEVNLINDLYKFKLLDSRKDSTMRRLFIHHNIYGICEFILNTKKSGKQVLYFDFNNLFDTEILNYIEEERFKNYLLYIMNKVKNILPIRVFYSTFSLEFLNSKIKAKSGLGIETVNKIKNLTESYSFDKFTFEKCKRFVRKQELTFLDQSYFNSLKAKQLLIN